MRRLAFLILLLASAAHASPLRIGTITIRTGALFDDAAAQHGAFYRGANRLQVPTRAALIRGLLLFREGDVLDETRLRETERNLRTLDFLKSAEVTTGAPHDGVVDVTVTTEDAFTTDPTLDFDTDGGRALFDVAVTQKNLFGSGAEADFRVNRGRERQTESFELIHPALLGPYWNGDALLARSSDGGEIRLAIERPLFSYQTPYTMSASFDDLRQDARLYDLGRVAALFAQHHREAQFAYGDVLAATPASALRWIGGVDVIADDFANREGIRPDDRHFRFLETGIDSEAFDFLKADHVDLGLREQDFNLGRHLSFAVAASPGSRTAFRFRSDDSFGWRMGAHSFLIARLTATTRAGATNRNAILSGDARFVGRLPTAHPQTFVARLRVDAAFDPDRDLQFVADGQNGLRAYPNFSFAGTKRVIANAEQRMFLGREWLQLVEPGLALFADAGEASNTFAAGKLKTDCGVGLRFAVARYESLMIRIDFAYALNAGPLNRRGPVVSFATTQAF